MSAGACVRMWRVSHCVANRGRDIEILIARVFETRIAHTAVGREPQRLRLPHTLLRTIEEYKRFVGYSRGRVHGNGVILVVDSAEVSTAIKDISMVIL